VLDAYFGHRFHIERASFQDERKGHRSVVYAQDYGQAVLGASTSAMRWRAARITPSSKRFRWNAAGAALCPAGPTPVGRIGWSITCQAMDWSTFCAAQGYPRTVD
jgi:hypothetical protein